MKVSSIKTIYSSGKNIIKTTCKKLSSATKSLIKTSPATDTFEKAINKVLSEGKNVEGGEKFASIIRRIVDPKPVTKKELDKLLSGLSVTEKLKLSDLISKFNDKMADFTFNLVKKFPAEGKTLSEKMMDISLNGSEFIYHLIK